MPLHPGDTVASLREPVKPRVLSDPVLCYHVVAALSSIPSARLRHTIVAWATVSGKCTGQNKRAVQRIRREVGADRG